MSSNMSSDVRPWFLMVAPDAFDLSFTSFHQDVLDHELRTSPQTLVGSVGAGPMAQGRLMEWPLLSSAPLVTEKGSW